jgi:acyl-CoA hydrolase
VARKLSAGSSFPRSELWRQSGRAAASISVLGAPRPVVSWPSWRRQFPDPQTSSSSASSALPQVEGATHTRYRHRAFFVGSEVRGLASSGQLDCVPISLEEVPELLTSGRLPIDVALLQVSDALVNVDVPVAEYLHPETGEIAERVARYIASVIDDGSTLQIGLGRVRRCAISGIGATP